MATINQIEYKVVTGTVGAISTFNTAVNTAIDAGYALVPGGVYSDVGGDIWQIMFKLNAPSSAITPAWLITVAPTIGVAGLGVFTLVGNLTAYFNAGHRFSVAGSTANDGVYSVKNGGATYSAPNTIIHVNEAVVSAVADGTIIDFSPF